MLLSETWFENFANIPERFCTYSAMIDWLHYSAFYEKLTLEYGKKLYAGPRHCISLSPFLNLFCSENISRQHKKQMWTATHRMCTNCGRQYHIPCNKNRNSGGSVGAIVPQANVHLAYMRLHRSDNMHHTQPFLYVICIFFWEGAEGAQQPEANTPCHWGARPIRPLSLDRPLNRKVVKHENLSAQCTLWL